MRKEKGEKAAGTHNISARMLKARSEAMIHGLHAVLTGKGVGCPHLERVSGRTIP